MNAGARESEKAKTYDEIDWNRLIVENELNNLYVSQLDLYLMRNLQLSKRDCEKKGFKKKQKIEEVKKHFYKSACSGSPIDDDINATKTQQRVHVALSVDTFSNGAPTTLDVPPWGGTIMVPHVGHITLVNTCPIDNFLTIFCPYENA